jgi:hypothetical protein
VLSKVAEKRLNLARDVEAVVGGDDVVGGALDIVVESASQLRQYPVELGDQIASGGLRESFAHRLE